MSQPTELMQDGDKPSNTAPIPFPTADNHPKHEELKKPVAQPVTEDALDKGIEESFPASDPVSVVSDKSRGVKK